MGALEKAVQETGGVLDLAQTEIRSSEFLFSKHSHSRKSQRLWLNATCKAGLLRSVNFRVSESLKSSLDSRRILKMDPDIAISIIDCKH